MKKEKITLAAITIVMSLPISTMQIVEIAKSYGVDHREVMVEVDDMLKAEQVFELDAKEG